MKLRNKKTGEVVEDGYVRETHDFQFDGQKHVLAVFKGNGHRPPERISGAYTSLAELNEEWEDYEGPKEYWRIDCDGEIEDDEYNETVSFDRDCKAIGNYFESREEAERAVEKLKAWKRLKDKGFKFTDWYRDVCEVSIQAEIYDEGTWGTINDLDLLFGEEEE